MKTVYQIEFEQDGSWWRAHHDFDGIEPEYTNKRKAQADLVQLRRDYPDHSFKIVER